MKWIVLLAVGTLALGVTGCASQSQAPEQASEKPTAQSSNGSETDAVAKAEPESSDVICRREVVTGTHFKRTVCTSRKARKQRQDEAARVVEQERRQVTPPASAGL